MQHEQDFSSSSFVLVLEKAGKPSEDEGRGRGGRIGLRLDRAVLPRQLILLGLLALPLPAATLTWDADGVVANGAGGGTGTWDATLLNWFDGASDVAWTNAQNHDAVFTGAGGVVTTTTDLVANSLTFDSRPFVIFNGGAAQKLTVTSGLISVAANQVATIFVNLTNGVNTPDVGVSKLGPGKLYLSRNPSFLGGLRVLEGTLSLSNKFQIGASGGSLMVNGGTLELTPGQAAVNQAVSGRTLFLGNDGATIDVAASPFGDWSFTDVQGTNGTLTKTGEGVLSFSGPSARSGATIINAGVLRANNSSSSSLGSGAVTVNANGTLGGVGRVAGLVSGSGTNTFTVKLSATPTNEVAVTTTFTSGDADLFVNGGANLFFNSTNWDVPQAVSLAAVEDGDMLNGQAMFTVVAAGLGDRVITATELDNDCVPPTGPNFLIICTDDQRWDSLGVVQREQGALARFPWFETPNLDQLAAEGVRFRNAFVVHSLCSPSRACMLTGRYGHLNGTVNNKTFFPTNAVTWATVLGAAGYTNGYVGKWHMGTQSGQRPGFHYSASFIGQGNYFDVPFEINGVLTNTTGWVDDVSTDFATNFITRNRSNAFALFVGYKAPHNPDTPADRFLNLYSSVTANPPLNADAVPAWDPSPSSSPIAKIRNYHRCVAGVDENVGRLLTLLDQLNLSSNTVVIFLSDNGRYLGDHGQGDKRSAYEESLRIPFLVRYPKLIAPGNVVDQIALNLDFAPTILDLAGLPVPPEMQGRSLQPLLTGAPPDWRQSFFYEYFIEGGSVVPNIYAFRTTPNKLVQYQDHEEWMELFDLANDSHETNNLIANPAYAQTRTNLQTMLRQQMRELGLLAELKSSGRTGNTFQLSLVGGIGPGWQVESSTNLTAWFALTNLAMTNVVDGVGQMEITDPDAIPPRKQYRARLISNE